MWIVTPNIAASVLMKLLWLYKLHKEGKDVVSIRKAVDKAFARN